MGVYDAVAGRLARQYAKETAQLAGADLQRAASSQPTGQGDPAWADVGYGNQFIGGGTKTVGNVTYNPNYYNNLLAQGHTKDPYTGAAIPGANLKGLTATQMRTVGKAQRDVKALFDLTQGASPQIDMQTAMKAKEAMERKYGVETLIHIPEYRELAGQNEAFEAQKQAAVQARAQETGRDIWTWDDETGKVTLDRDKYVNYQLDQEDAEIAQKPIIAKQKAEMELAADAKKSARAMADKQFDAMLKQGVQPDQAFQIWNKLREEADANRRNEVRSLLGEGGQQQAAPAAALTHPKLPANTRIVGQFSTPADAAKGLAPNEYGIYKGSLIRKDSTGELKEVS